MDGFSLHQFLYKPAFDLLSRSLVMMDSNYPELLRRVMIVNAPAPFSIAFTLIKPFLHERTVQKIQIYGRSGWQNTLSSYVASNELPEIYGGTKTDQNGDPACSAEISRGGPVPKSYYLCSNQVSIDDDAETLTVAQKSECCIEVQVKMKDSFLFWEFQTEKHDIGFGILYKNSDKNNCKLEEIMPIEKFESCMIPEQGELKCLKAGIYILKFDNTHSYFRSKVVKYRYEIKPPPNTK